MLSGGYGQSENPRIVYSLELPELDRAEFATCPLSLALSEMFYETDVLYTYEEYREHLRQTLAWENGVTIKVQLRKFQTFRNIQIILNSGKWAMVSKSKAPAIHFVIRHPKMVEAIERFTPLIIESMLSTLSEKEMAGRSGSLSVSLPSIIITLSTSET